MEAELSARLLQNSCCGPSNRAEPVSRVFGIGKPGGICLRPAMLQRNEGRRCTVRRSFECFAALLQVPAAAAEVVLLVRCGAAGRWHEVRESKANLLNG